MIITITDHFHEALEMLAGSAQPTTDLQTRVAHDQHQQPAAFIVVNRETMNEILVELAKKGHIAITEGVS